MKLTLALWFVVQRAGSQINVGFPYPGELGGWAVAGNFGSGSISISFNKQANDRDVAFYCQTLSSDCVQ